jgi:hypothetical protein
MKYFRDMLETFGRRNPTVSPVTLTNPFPGRVKSPAVAATELITKLKSDFDMISVSFF